MTNNMKKVFDFIIKIIMIFTTVLALVFFAGYYPKQSLIFGFLALLFVLSIIIKGILDIFQRE